MEVGTGKVESNPDHIALADGERVDIAELIGRGGCGVVHRGVLHRADGTHEEVAVKKLGAGATQRDQEKFLKEIRKSILIAQNCEGVVVTHGALQHSGETCLIMQLYDGSLAQLLQNGNKLPELTALRYGIQIARALTSVHKQGVAVLDLKPANLLFDGELLYIGDFGISKVAEVTMPTMATHAGAAGTPAFMAAEQHDPDEYGLPGPPADIWAWGGVMLQMLTGEAPWAGLGPRQIWTQVAMKRKAPAIPAGLPPTLAAILSDCFTTEPGQRIDSEQLLERLLSLSDETASDARMSLCFSYATLTDYRVEEAKSGLEAMGHHVFYGLDISAVESADWRKQWCLGCGDADFCVNFCSDAYIRSESCAQEWNHAKLNKQPSRIINLVVGGRTARNQLLAVPIEEVADMGGMNIRMYFETGGQAVSVYDVDNIAEKILAQARGRPEVGSTRAAVRAATAFAGDEIGCLADLCAAAGIRSEELLSYSDVDVAELMRERQIGVVLRKALEKERTIRHEADREMKEAQRLEQMSELPQALSKYRSASDLLDIYGGSEMLALTNHISRVDAAIEAQRLAEEQHRAKVAAEQKAAAVAAAQRAAEAEARQ
jgi:hypothetical protein